MPAEDGAERITFPQLIFELNVCMLCLCTSTRTWVIKCETFCYKAHHSGLDWMGQIKKEVITDRQHITRPLWHIKPEAGHKVWIVYNSFFLMRLQCLLVLMFFPLCFFDTLWIVILPSHLHPPLNLLPPRPLVVEVVCHKIRGGLLEFTADQISGPVT